MAYFFAAATQVVILFIIIAVGFFMSKFGLLGYESSKQITNLLFYIITPAVIIRAMCNEKLSAETLSLVGVGIGAALICFGISIPVSLLFFRRDSRADRSVLRFAMAFSNCGFMGLPLADALVGERGVFIVSMFVVTFNIVAFTYGVSTFSVKPRFIKALFNPGTVGLLIGLPFFLFPIDMPFVFHKPLVFIAEVNTPLAMIVTGVFLAMSIGGERKIDRRVIVVTVMRLFVLPLAVIGIFKLMNLEGWIYLAAMIPVCAPSGSNTVLFAAKYDCNVALGSRLVSLTTVASVVSLPLLLTLVNAL